MLKLLKSEDDFARGARHIYAFLLAHIRSPVFYDRYDIPDTLTGRFDLLLVHVFLIMNRMLEYKDFNQALFDIMFADMDQALREQGIGDMSIPKHMKRMMKAFNGRMHAYQKALPDQTALKEVVKRNLYGTIINPGPAALEAMTQYLQKGAIVLEDQAAETILEGKVVLPQIQNEKK